ncbi:hypothetical protein LIER_30494 [Lithospermum erythrorhizon]|uniref:Uncharacterized protein n=1 Tax=Lithospermum erythrorhizon TaxID=34254 RepID=A0AAV3RMW2_LITER
MKASRRFSLYDNVSEDDLSVSDTLINMENLGLPACCNNNNNEFPKWKKKKKRSHSCFRVKSSPLLYYKYHEYGKLSSWVVKKRVRSSTVDDHSHAPPPPPPQLSPLPPSQPPHPNVNAPSSNMPLNYSLHNSHNIQVKHCSKKVSKKRNLSKHEQAYLKNNGQSHKLPTLLQSLQLDNTSTSSNKPAQEATTEIKQFLQYVPIMPDDMILSLIFNKNGKKWINKSNHKEKGQSKSI